MKNTLSILFAFLATISFAQTNGIAYNIYDQKGKELSFEKFIKNTSKNEVLLFGEYHNNSIIHWLQLQTLKALKTQEQNLVIGAEMFETDNQLLIDEYFLGLVKQSNFEKEMKLWNNYSTDYKPILEFAYETNSKFVATNIPRRYASIVSSKGLDYLDSLSEEAKSYIAPLPIKFGLEIPGYQEMLKMMGMHGDESKSINFVAAQASKDATMAHFIEKNLKPNSIFVHFNGDFHSKEFGGIYWYLKRNNVDLKVETIAVVESENFEFEKDYEKLGNYIILIPTDMTKTY